tara:strand:+ start:416 stop:589 length:174 start_codon:yes stop_codon:yes gene_type:complete
MEPSSPGGVTQAALGHRRIAFGHRLTATTDQESGGVIDPKMGAGYIGVERFNPVGKS